MDDKDLFAPPTQEELQAIQEQPDTDDDLFAPPSERELQLISTEDTEDYLDAPPTMGEYNRMKSSDSDITKVGRVLSNFGSTVGGHIADMAHDALVTSSGALGQLAGGVGNVIASKLFEEDDTFTDPRTGETFNVSTPKTTVLDDYYRGKEIMKQARDEAYDRSPVSSFIGEAVGTLGQGAGTGQLISKGASRIPQLADLLNKYTKLKESGGILKNTGLGLVEGGAVGATTGAMTGDSQTLRGDIRGTVDDAFIGSLLGGGMGAIAGGTLTAAKKGVEWLGKDGLGERFKDAFGFEKQGKVVLGQKAVDNVRRESTELAEDFLHDIDRKSAELGGYLDDTMRGKRISINDEISDMEDLAKSYMEGGSNYINRATAKDAETIYENFIKGSRTDLTAREAESVSRQLRKKVTNLDGETNIDPNSDFGKMIAKKSKELQDSIRDKLDDPNLKTVYDEYKTLKDMSETAKVSHGKYTSKAEDLTEMGKVRGLMLEGSDSASIKNTKFERMDSLLSDYKKVFGGKEGKQLDNRIKDAQRYYNVVGERKTGRGGFLTEAGGVIGVTTKLGAMSGRMSKGIIDNAESFKRLLGSNRVSNYIKSTKSGQLFAEKLLPLLEGSRAERITGLHALMQQKPFRDFLAGLQEKIEDSIPEALHDDTYDY